MSKFESDPKGTEVQFKRQEGGDSSCVYSLAIDFLLTQALGSDFLVVVISIVLRNR